MTQLVTARRWMIAALVSSFGCATATDPGVGFVPGDGGRDVSVLADSGTTPGDGGVDAPGAPAADAPCAAPKMICGGKCADLTLDKDNCGSCGNACLASAACVAGKCKATCGGDTTDCSGVCVNLLTDKDNCATCGAKCGKDASGVDKICVGAACKVDCATKTSCPGDTCADLLTDDKNCGACGKACLASQRCAAGACIACASTSTICVDKCVDTKTDAANCGACGKACPSGASCSAGACVCASGLTDCTGTCKDLKNDGANCGGCGVACATGLVCNAGACTLTCGTGRAACGGSCIDVTSDPKNCGACAKSCDATAPFCSAGTCVSMPKCNGGAPQVLFYGPISGTSAGEVPFLPAGAVATYADATKWSSMTTSDFAKYQLIVIGEGASTFSTKTLWDTAYATQAAWAPAVGGRVVVHTMDPVVHAGYGRVDAKTFATAALAWAAGGPGTGLYVGPDFGNRKLDFLSAFGAWVVLGQVTDSFSGDPVHVLLTTHGTMVGSTDATLSGWSITFHGGVTAVPTGFVTVANGTSGATTAGVVVARDVTCAP